MNKLITPIALALTVFAIPLAASASESDAGCPDISKDQWMSEADITAKAVELGYEVRSIKAEDGCFEVYAIDKNKAKAEVLFNPVTGEIVSRKDAD